MFSMEFDPSKHNFRRVEKMMFLFLVPWVVLGSVSSASKIHKYDNMQVFLNKVFQELNVSDVDLCKI